MRPNFKVPRMSRFIPTFCYFFLLLSYFYPILRPPAGRQMTTLPMPISQQPLNRSSPNFQQLLLMSNKGKLVSFSSFAHG